MFLSRVSSLARCLPLLVGCWCPCQRPRSSQAPLWTTLMRRSQSGGVVGSLQQLPYQPLRRQCCRVHRQQHSDSIEQHAVFRVHDTFKLFNRTSCGIFMCMAPFNVLYRGSVLNITCWTCFALLDLCLLRAMGVALPVAASLMRPRIFRLYFFSLPLRPPSSSLSRVLAVESKLDRGGNRGRPTGAKLCSGHGENGGVTTGRVFSCQLAGSCASIAVWELACFSVVRLVVVRCVIQNGHEAKADACCFPPR